MRSPHIASAAALLAADGTVITSRLGMLPKTKSSASLPNPEQRADDPPKVRG